jgi:hypothetical protein
VRGWDTNSPASSSQTSTSRSPFGLSIPTQEASIDPFPTRIQTLVTELLQVILSVITPSRAFSPQSLQSSPTIPSAFPPSPDANTSLPIPTHTTLLMRALDPPYTAQLLQHGQLDTPTLSSIFSLIGSILKCHCAPMRDGVVDAMVALASAPLLKETKKDRTKRAIKVFKRCFEIVELMRLVSKISQITCPFSFPSLSFQPFTPPYIFPLPASFQFGFSDVCLPFPASLLFLPLTLFLVFPFSLPRPPQRAPLFIFTLKFLLALSFGARFLLVLSAADMMARL